MFIYVYCIHRLAVGDIIVAPGSWQLSEYNPHDYGFLELRPTSIRSLSWCVLMFLGYIRQIVSTASIVANDVSIAYHLLYPLEPVTMFGCVYMFIQSEDW